MLAGGVQHALLDVQHQRAAVAGKELDLVLGGLVGAQQTVLFVVAAAVHRRGEDLVQTVDRLRAGGLEQSLGARAGVNVAGEDTVGILEDVLRVVGEDDLRLGAAAFHQLGVVGHVVNAGELVLHLAEQGAELLQRQHVAVGVDAGGVHRIEADERVAHLVGRIAEHQHHLAAALGDAAQQNGKAVARKDRENHADRTAAELGAHICGNIINACIVAL